MRTSHSVIWVLALMLLFSTGLVVAATAQEVSILDPGLNAAIRAELQKPNGPLTQRDLLSLTNLNACCLDIGSLEGLEAARNLTMLQLENNRLGNFDFPSSLTRLTYLDLSANEITNLFLPDGLTNLTSLNLTANAFTRLSLPPGLTGLTFLQVGVNQLTNVTLPDDLRNLSLLSLEQNQLANLTLPSGLTNLSILVLSRNQLTSLTLPPDLPHLTRFLLGGNPLASLVLSEPAAVNLAGWVASLRSGGITVFTYPLTVELSRLRQPAGAFQFSITGPPGNYTIFASTDLSVWTELGTVSNLVGSIVFTDTTAHLSSQKFYRTMR